MRKYFQFYLIIKTKKKSKYLMEELTLTTPALLFSAISLIMLAYTNRFLAYAAVIRNLHDKYLEKQDDSLIEQIRNLKLRLNLTRWMQIFGITSLLLCVLTMFLIYIQFHVFAVWVFGVALVLLILSLALLVKEIQISIRALSLHLKDIEKHLKKK
jgi:amino acid transporter